MKVKFSDCEIGIVGNFDKNGTFVPKFLNDPKFIIVEMPVVPKEGDDFTFSLSVVPKYIVEDVLSTYKEEIKKDILSENTISGKVHRVVHVVDDGGYHIKVDISFEVGEEE